MWRVHLPPFSFGASYQQSPVKMSGRPSLLTSTTQTPSERNAVSTTVFFQVSLAGAFASPAVRGGTASAIIRSGRTNFDRPVIANLGEKEKRSHRGLSGLLWAAARGSAIWSAAV